MSKPHASVSKKWNKMSNEEGSQCLPLDKTEIEVIDDQGRCKKVSAIDKYFMEPRQFILYKPLYSFNGFGDSPDVSSSFCAKDEWIQRMEFLEEDLHWLLKLPHHRFWSQVIYDDTLHQSLNSFLLHSPRDFDLSSFTEADVLMLSQKVHKLVFFVYLRMSTYKESKPNCISPEAFGELIYENYLFDIPKIMDLCSLYGRKNGAILKKMISNIFNTQPSYTKDLETAVFHLSAKVFDSVEKCLNLNQKSDEMAPTKIEDHVSLGISSVSLSKLIDVIYYITDISTTLSAFMDIYSPSCHIFYKYGLALRLASFYDNVFPSIENELLVREDDAILVVESSRLKVRHAKTLMIKIFRNLITSCCIQPIIEAQCSKVSEEEVFQRLEEFMEVFMEVVAHRHFICDYNKMFPFDADVTMLSEMELSIDPTRLDYIFNSIHQSSDSVICNGGPSFSNDLNKTENLKRNYSCNVSKEHNVKDLLSLAATLNAVSDTGAAAATARCSEVELESFIVSVLDVLPELGPGFVEECLNYYTFDTEKVIDALLQDTLPVPLRNLDRSMQRKPVPKTEEPLSLLSERRNIFDNDEFDMFNRKDVDMKRIHLGKKDKTPDTYVGLLDDTSEIGALLKKISLSAATEGEVEAEERYAKGLDLYEDEYDDTYDSTMLGLIEQQTEKELQAIRPFTTPRVLEKRSRDIQIAPADEVEDEEEDEEENQEQQPEVRRDQFIANPEIQRERYEQRRQSQAAARNRRPPRSSRGDEAQNQGTQERQQNNRKHKEKHKSQIANHDRRRQGDYKRSRGMGLLPSR